MASSIIIEIVIILALLLGNGLLAMAEIAVITSRKSRLESLLEDGDQRAEVVLELQAKPNDFLSTVQTGITMIGIIAGAFGGATLADELGELLSFLPLEMGLIQSIAVAIVVLLITYLSLVIGELVPKRVALSNPEIMALRLARPMRLLSKLTRLPVMVLARSTDFFIRLLRVEEGVGSTFTKEEVQILIDQGKSSGVFEAFEAKMVEQVFKFDDMSINALLTPRRDVIWLDICDSPQVISEKVMNTTHTWIPVAEDQLDKVVGIVNINDILKQVLTFNEIRLEDILTQPVFVPENIPVYQVLDKFKEHGTQVVLVIDEYGGFDGLVTGDDILEAIVGEIQEGDESADARITNREDGTWLVDGYYQFDAFQDEFEIPDIDKIHDRFYQTVGGFIMTSFGHIPAAGDYFERYGFRFEVIDMDGRRVDKVLVTRL
jgi:putative hemolysin